MVTGTGREVLVGVDGSDASREALRAGARIARGLGVPLVAVMCWEGPRIYEGWQAVDPGRPPAGTEERLRSAVADTFGAELPERFGARLVHGRPAARLVEESRDAALLVLGRRGHGGMPGAGLGSVSRACVAHAGCPVLVVTH
ncbi:MULTISPECIES: universal stress protein [Kocuria]|uniref:Universal stress protein n=1 Tax=Kocuria oceani TaxID=988827 RepID=A0ABV9TMH1_9MICC|nr:MULTISPECIES: universal stress protein [Kocuria]KLU10704.1 universal stress protein UspA [Kocuria sp. SM24M-10]OLT11657.1 universal stress protein UspA [Kocuria sp. CNJ-770]